MALVCSNISPKRVSNLDFFGLGPTFSLVEPDIVRFVTNIASNTLSITTSFSSTVKNDKDLNLGSKQQALLRRFIVFPE